MTGKIRLDKVGTYTFRMFHGGGARLYLDNQLKIDDWSAGAERFSPETTYSNPVAGSYVSITYETNKLGTSGTAVGQRIAAVLHQKEPGAADYVNTNLYQQLTPAYNLTTSATAYDSQLGNVTSTTQYKDPAYGTVASTTLDPTGLNLQNKATYEAPGAGYLRQTSKTLPGGNVTSYTHYGATETRSNPCVANSPAISQAGFIKSKSEPDPDGNPSTTDKPGINAPRVSETVYDSAGRTVATRYNGDAWTCTSYDARGRVLSNTVPAVEGRVGRSISNEYALGGNPLITASTDETGLQSQVEADLLGRKIRYRDANGYETTNTYDSLGQLIHRSGPSGSEDYTYDVYGKLTQQKQDGQIIGTITYDQYGRIATTTANVAGVVKLSQLTYDEYGRTKAQEYTLPTQTNGKTNILTENVDRSVTGAIQKQYINGVSLSGNSSTYTDDKANRLTSSSYAGHNYSYEFGSQDTSCSTKPGYNANASKNGNRTKTTVDGVATTYCYNNADQLIYSSDPELDAPQYDSHGNTTSLGTGINQTRFTYDQSDRNIAIEKGTASTAGYARIEYVRDNSGRIIKTTEKTWNTATNSLDTKIYKYGYTAEGDSPDFLTDNSGSILEKYIPLPGGMLLTIRPNETDVAKKNLVTIPNLHGDTLAVIDGNGQIQGGVKLYDPFGQSIVATTAFLTSNPSLTNALDTTATSLATADNRTSTSDYGWLGQHQKQSETLFSLKPIQMGARVYIAKMGRFLQVDPQDGGNDNAYSYVNDPVNAFDLDGNLGWSDVSNFAKNHWKDALNFGAGMAAGIIVTALMCGATAGIGCIVAAGAIVGGATSLVTTGTDQVRTGTFNPIKIASAVAGGAIEGATGALAGHGIMRIGAKILARIGGSAIGKSSTTAITNFGQKLFNSKVFGVNSKLLGRGGSTYTKGILNRGPIRVGWGPAPGGKTAVLRIAIGKAGWLHFDFTKARW